MCTQIQFPNTGGIYQILNLVNGKIYVGSSNNINNRKRSHLHCLRNNRHRNQHLQYAWNKYGEHNFEFEILQIVKISKSLTGCEQFWISSTSCTDRKYGYNIAINAQHPSLGTTLTKEHKQKISEGTKKALMAPEKRKRMSIANTGSNNYMYGRKHSKQTRIKMSTKRQNRIITEETKQNMSIVKRGELNCNAKLVTTQVKVIRHLCEFKIITQKSIAEFFNVSLGTIESIKARKTWKYI